MVSMESLARVLGGKSVLGRLPRDENDLIELVRQGLPYASFEHVADSLAATLEETAESLGLPRRRLGRRKEKGASLRPDESERVMRLARVAVQAEEVLGSMEKAHRWLRKPNRALGGRTPISMLDVDLGAKAVEQVLGRIQYGVYS